MDKLKFVVLIVTIAVLIACTSTDQPAADELAAVPVEPTELPTPLPVPETATPAPISVSYTHLTLPTKA